jgi:CubicO group peptidase (beta-lactamase class C family)
MPVSLKSLLRILMAVSTGVVSVATSQTAVGETNELGCGLHKDTLQAIYARLGSDEHPDLKGIVILCNGQRVSENYFNGDKAESLHDIRSATKSITATLMGIAIQRGLVHSVDDSIALYLPGLPRDGKQDITIRDLLTMRSGLSANDEDPLSPGNEDNLDKSTDWLKAAYAVPVKAPPGRTYVYCSLNAFLTGVIVANAAKMPLEEFARHNLFLPLGISRFDWARAAGGQTKGQGTLSIGILRQLDSCTSTKASSSKNESWIPIGLRRAGPNWCPSRIVTRTPISMGICGISAMSQQVRTLLPSTLLLEAEATRFTSYRPGTS